MKQAILKQQRSEYGKVHRKAYENGCRQFGGRASMKELVPKSNGKSETITTSIKDNYLIELYDLNQKAYSRLVQGNLFV